MVNVAPDLNKWVNDLSRAKQDVLREEAAAREERERLQSTLTGRFRAWLKGPKSEQAVKQKKEVLERIQSGAKAAALSWVRQEAMNAIASSPSVSHSYQQQRQRVGHVEKRTRQVARLMELARMANDRVDRARRDCESASDTEMWDMLSSNKAISVLSSLETSDASQSLRSASRALKALAEALPKRSESVDFDLPDDGLDLLVDLVFDPGLDILSFFNMQALDDAAEACSEVQKKIAPLLSRLRQTHERALSLEKAERAKLAETEAPFLRSAAEKVPAAIRITPPSSVEDLTAPQGGEIRA